MCNIVKLYEVVDGISYGNDIDSNRPVILNTIAIQLIFKNRKFKFPHKNQIPNFVFLNM